MLRATTVLRNSVIRPEAPATRLGVAVLLHDERHLRRKVMTLTSGLKILVDLAEPVILDSGDELLMEDGSRVSITAAQEELYSVTPRDLLHLIELAWHIGNRHLPAAIFSDHIELLRDHVIRSMLEGLGAKVDEIVAPFSPLRGAYDSHGHGHGHGHGQSHHDHHHHDHHQ